ncbi:MAG: tRNA pseudouridine(38-40) synthase TruA [Legionellaceae bacterium]|nr:tRNA pseudouridine(38-40) synthase TruA [Legionellaceae bacterium]
MRVALSLSYDGRKYHGWQAQPQVPTVQALLEIALAQIAQHPIDVTCAGRTDAKVHAMHQVVHFDSHALRRTDAWIHGCNRFLPPEISVNWAAPVADDFHARYSATARRYVYIIDNRTTRPSILRHQVTWIYAPLDAQKMHEAAQFLLGEQDFTSFRAAECQSHTAHRCVHAISVKRTQHYIYIDITANAFLHHMVRNIVGVLMMIGGHKKPLSWIQEVLDARNRSAAAETAAPQGLYLVDVVYPAHYQIPRGSFEVYL